MQQHASKINTMKLVLLAGIVLMALKFLAWYLTGSNAILTDAVESIVNVLAGGFALYSLYYAARPKDEDHPYGHGKIEFLSTGVEGGMVTLAGLAMIVKAGFAFFHPQSLQYLNVGVLITLFSGLANFVLGRLLILKGRTLHSSTMVADGRHLLTDTWSSLGLVVGLGIIYFTQWYWMDAVITLVLGSFIMYTGFDLVKESVFNLLDTADNEKIKHLVAVLNAQRKESWIDVHNLRVLKYGAVVHVDCHMTLPWYYTLDEAHREVSELGQLAKKSLDYETEFFIHADPCLPISCSVCSMRDCRVRQQAQVTRLEWTMQNVLPDAKHTAQADP